MSLRRRQPTVTVHLSQAEAGDLELLAHLMGVDQATTIRAMVAWVLARWDVPKALAADLLARLQALENERRES